MRILHFSDTHLGYGLGSRLSPHGVNQREEDLTAAFRWAVERALETKPDLVIHSGDLIDDVRPGNRVIKVALDAIRRLSEAGQETVLISGNHDTPRLRETGSIFALFDGMKHIYPVYKGACETVEVGGAMVHCVPHSNNIAGEALRIEPVQGHLNIAVFHAGVESLLEFRNHEMGETIVPDSALRYDLDYVALGHYHRHMKVKENAWYAGSTERLSFSEADWPKGATEVEVHSGGLKVRHVQGPSRPMFNLRVDCRGLDAKGVQDACAEKVGKRIDEKELDGALIRLVLDSVASSALRALDQRAVKSLAPDALLFKIDARQAEDSGAGVRGAEPFGDLASEWTRFLAERGAGRKGDRLRELGARFLEPKEVAE
ncbi:MAG TPA: exonuclease SbcCD subunit D [Thermoplasmata archaeon]|nr:exonuclease SbcCD subunit D [Thermoplasmata archaeon]